MKALMEAEENQHFGEALTWILNKQSAPYSNGPLLKQSLKSLQDLFSGQFFFFFSFGMWNVEIFFLYFFLFSSADLSLYPFSPTDESSSGYFYTNDLKVLVDIFIREITNLDTKDVMRSGKFMCFFQKK